MEKLIQLWQSLLEMTGSRLTSAVAAIVGGGFGLIWPAFTVRAMSLALLAFGVSWAIRWYRERP